QPVLRLDDFRARRHLECLQQLRLHHRLQHRDGVGEGRAEENARIKLKIPAGVDTGSRLRSSGQGEAGARGGPAGDLYVVLSVLPHPVFQRDEDDLHCDVPISFCHLALGAEISVPSLEGELKLKVPAGTASNKVFRLRDQGVP
ncbi:MAG: DnaJ C-terminal domain-containing protein, partial [Verrucomicrobiota bacterium]